MKTSSKFVYRGDDYYISGSIGEPLDQADQTKRAQEAVFHIRNSRSKTKRYTSFTLSKVIAGKFTKRRRIRKVAWVVLKKLESEGRIRILTPDDTYNLIKSNGNKRISRLAHDMKMIMEKNREILIEGEIPVFYENKQIILPVQ